MLEENIFENDLNFFCFFLKSKIFDTEIDLNVRSNDCRWLQHIWLHCQSSHWLFGWNKEKVFFHVLSEKVYQKLFFELYLYTKTMHRSESEVPALNQCQHKGFFHSTWRWSESLQLFDVHNKLILQRLIIENWLSFLKEGYGTYENKGCVFKY